MKSFVFFVAGAAAATAAIGYSIKDELPAVVESKVTKIIDSTIFRVERQLFGAEVALKSRNRKIDYANGRVRYYSKKAGAR